MLKQKDIPAADSHYIDYATNMARYNSISNKIRMQLNSNEPDHKAIEEILDRIDIKLDEENIVNFTGKELEVDLKIIIAHSKTIFKSEWEKSKKLYKI